MALLKCSGLSFDESNVWIVSFTFVFNHCDICPLALLVEWGNRAFWTFLLLGTRGELELGFGELLRLNKPCHWPYVQPITNTSRFLQEGLLLWKSSHKLVQRHGGQHLPEVFKPFTGRIYLRKSKFIFVLWIMPLPWNVVDCWGLLPGKKKIFSYQVVNIQGISIDGIDLVHMEYFSLSTRRVKHCSWDNFGPVMAKFGLLPR